MAGVVAFGRPGAPADVTRYLVGEARRAGMPQLPGRDALIARVAAAVERAVRAGGGTVVVSGPAGVGVTAVVDAVRRSVGAEPTPESASSLRDDITVQWIDDAQRMPASRVDGLRAAAATQVVVISGRRPLGHRLSGLVRDAVRADTGSVLDVDALAPEEAIAAIGRGDIETARACGGRLRLLAAVAEAGGIADPAAVVAADARSGRPGTPVQGGAGASAVQIAVEDLLADLAPEARRLFEVIALGGENPRIAAVEAVSGAGTAFDGVLGELAEAGLVEVDGERLRTTVPIVASVVAAHLGVARAAVLHAAFAEALVGLAGADLRETADHVRLAADRLPPDLSIGVLRASAARRLEAFDPDGAVADLEVAAALAESAAERGTRDDRVRAFETLLALASAQYFAGPLARAETLLRRAERFRDVATVAQLDEIELYRVYLRADRGQPAEIPLAAAAQEAPDQRAAIAVRHLFLADRGDDVAELDTICGILMSFDGEAASPTGRGAAALGRSVRASLAGDLALAQAEAEHGLAIASDAGPEVVGGFARELIRLCTLRGDLAAAQRYADLSFEGLVPRVVEASVVVHRASIAVMRGDLVEGAERAELALAMTRAAPVPRGLVRCAAWVALLSAMRGDVTRARSLVAEAARMFPLEGNLRLATIVQLARVQLLLREGGPMPPSFEFRLERTEGPSRLLLPTLTARLALERGDDDVTEKAISELDALADASPPAAALAQRLRALQLVRDGRPTDAIGALDDSADALEGLGFAGLAAETRLEWAELAAERGDPAARSAVLALVPYFDAQGLDDWSDRARRLARTIGVRIGGRRGGSGTLTRRESEVVDLVVAGLSNAEIARRLFLSERTIETHLQHVYRRLGVDSRLALIQRLAATGEDPDEAP